jgi:hypothetical protein
MQPPIDRARYRRETEAGIAAFLAAGGTIKMLPGFRGGPRDRFTGKVAGIRRDADGGWIVVIISAIGHYWGYQADHPDMPRPKLRSTISFELAPVPFRTGHVEGRMKAVKLELCNG